MLSSPTGQSTKSADGRRSQSKQDRACGQEAMSPQELAQVGPFPSTDVSRDEGRNKSERRPGHAHNRRPPGIPRNELPGDGNERTACSNGERRGHVLQPQSRAFQRNAAYRGRREEDQRREKPNKPEVRTELWSFGRLPLAAYAIRPSRGSLHNAILPVILFQRRTGSRRA